MELTDADAMANMEKFCNDQDCKEEGVGLRKVAIVHSLTCWRRQHTCLPSASVPHKPSVVKIKVEVKVQASTKIS